MRIILILFFFFIFTSLGIYAQDSLTNKLNTSLLFGYQVGGQGENRNFVTKNGISVQLNLLYKFNNFISAGPGIGYAYVDEETYIPAFITFKGFLKEKKNSPYLNARLGFSFVDNQKISALESFDFHGGLYFTAGWGYQWSLNEKVAIDFQINMEFQETELEFTSFSGEKFNDDIQNYFLSFKTGVNF